MARVTLVPADAVPTIRGWLARAAGELAATAAVADPSVRLRALEAHAHRRIDALPRAPEADRLRAHALVLLMRDLAGQGWTLVVDGEVVHAELPEHHAGHGAAEATKTAVRAQLHAARHRQLEQASTRAFMERMERRRTHRGRKVSIRTLMRDGPTLAAALEATQIAPPADRSGALHATISPYLQPVDAHTRCEHTGLKLSDIWRYFRHTWASPYQPVPGRSMALLVRDAAAPFHPIVGIAALSSPVMHLGLRDEHIGWEWGGLLDELSRDPQPRLARWLNALVERQLDGIHLEDFLSEGQLSPAQLADPDEAAWQRLHDLSKTERERHVLEGGGAGRKLDSDSTDAEFLAEARTALFRSKRAKELAVLLEARAALAEASHDRAPAEALAHLLSSGAGRRVVRMLLVRAKRERVGISLADISVCGALPPYSHLLGGKLVAMLLTSPEVVAIYRHRYASAASIIASSMAGRRVVREPSLAYLTTTSLYSVHASQYSRVRVPCDRAGGRSDERVEYRRLGHTEGQGSMHLARDTTTAFIQLLELAQGGRRVNYRFGEGASPRMRLVREAMEHLGLDPDALLSHGNPRVLYAISLVRNPRDFLLGLDNQPDYLLDGGDGVAATAGIARWWVERWLAPRSLRRDVLERVRREHGHRHGARVPQTRDQDPQQPLFESPGSGAADE